MALLTLDEVSQQTGVSVRRLRYYIDRGWLPRPVPMPSPLGRPPGGLPSEAVERVLLIKQMRQPLDPSLLDDLGSYVYELGGKTVVSKIVAKEEAGDYALLMLENGDRVLRKGRKEEEDDARR